MIRRLAILALLAAAAIAGVLAFALYAALSAREPHYDVDVEPWGDL